MYAFYEKYPEFKSTPFFMTGESYAGKYIPLFAKTILDGNEQREAQSLPTIPLAGALIGDPLNSPPIQRLLMPTVPRALDIVDDYQMNQIDTLARHCEESLVADPENRSTLCDNIMGYIRAVSAGIFDYDARIFSYDWDPIEDEFNNFMNTCTQSAALYEAIHISQSPKRPYYTPSSYEVAMAYDSEEMDDYTWIYNELLIRGLPILIYAGEFDIKDGPRTQEPWFRNIQALQSTDFFTQARKVYYIQDDKGNQLVGGYYKESMVGEGYFTFLAVPKAGHFVPTTYLVATKFMLKDFLETKTLQCHDVDKTKCHIGYKQCEYMKFCHAPNQGFCVNGFCQCSGQYTGADCSVMYSAVNTNYNKVFKTNGVAYKYFRFDGSGFKPASEDYFFTVTSDNPILDVYLSKDYAVAPTQYQYDMMFKS